MGRNAISPFPPARMRLNACLPARGLSRFRRCCRCCTPEYPREPQMSGILRYFLSLSLSPFSPGKAAAGNCDLMGIYEIIFYFQLYGFLDLVPLFMEKGVGTLDVPGLCPGVRLSFASSIPPSLGETELKQDCECVLFVLGHVDMSKHRHVCARDQRAYIDGAGLCHPRGSPTRSPRLRKLRQVVLPETVEAQIHLHQHASNGDD